MTITSTRSRCRGNPGRQKCQASPSTTKYGPPLSLFPPPRTRRCACSYASSRLRAATSLSMAPRPQARRCSSAPFCWIALGCVRVRECVPPFGFTLTCRSVAVAATAAASTACPIVVYEHRIVLVLSSNRRFLGLRGCLCQGNGWCVQPACADLRCMFVLYPCVFAVVCTVRMCATTTTTTSTTTSVAATASITTACRKSSGHGSGGNPMKSPIFRRPPETSIFPHFSTPETGD